MHSGCESCAADTILHIGFHKTGTTALQRHFFPRLAGCDSLGPDDHVFRILCWNLMHTDDEGFRRHAWSGLLHDAGHDRPLVLSYEDLSYFVQDGRTPRRLYDLMPGARVVAVVRNQAAALRSFYHLYLKQGGTLSFARWAAATTDFDRLAYDTTIASYQEVFGPAQVSVLLYEDLVARPAAFLAELARFVLGDDPEDRVSALPMVNRSVSRLGSEVFRRMNRAFCVSRYNPSPVLRASNPNDVMAWVRKQEGRLPKRLLDWPGGNDREAVGHAARYFEAGNARLATLTGLDLAAYGYPMPAR